MPEPARTERVQGIVADFERRAAAREWETQFDLGFPDGAVMFGRSNFWTSLDVRDAAQAIEKSLLTDIEGSHAIYVTDAHNFVGLPTRELAAVFFPGRDDVEASRRGHGDAGEYRTRRSRLIGFEPQLSHYPQEINYTMTTRTFRHHPATDHAFHRIRRRLRSWTSPTG